MKRKILGLLLITALIVTLFPLLATANTTNVNVTVNNGSATEKVGNSGWINWEKGVIKATGIGVPSSKARTQAAAKAGAKEAAKQVAQRNLVGIIHGLQIDSETTVEELELTSDIIKRKISGFLVGVQVFDEKELPDGSWEVVVGVQLYGNNGLNRVIYETQPPQTQPIPQPSAEYIPASISGHTGLVIDARGLKLDRCFSPKVYDQTGREIFGTMYVDPDFLQEKGLVSYASSAEMLSLTDRGQSRAGANPIVVKAIKVRDHNYNVVISKADGDRILAANNQSGFLQQCKVVIKK